MSVKFLGFFLQAKIKRNRKKTNSPSENEKLSIFSLHLKLTPIFSSDQKEEIPFFSCTILPEVNSSANIFVVDQRNAFLRDFVNITRMSVAELKQKCKVLAAIPTCTFIKNRGKNPKPPISPFPGYESFACYF